MFLSRSGLDLSEIWSNQIKLAEMDAHMQDVRKRHAAGDASDEELLHNYRRSGEEHSPEAISLRYKMHSRARDEAHRRYNRLRHDGGHWAETSDRLRAAHDGVRQTIEDTREHHGRDAGLYLTPHSGHDVHSHIQDLLSASGGKAYDARPGARQDDGSHVGHIAATTWSDTPAKTGIAFDKAFKAHYQHSGSRSEPMAIRQDSQNTDRNGRRYTIHPEDVRR